MLRPMDDEVNRATVALALTPPEKRIEFLLHVTLATVLTVFVMEMK